MNWVQSPWRGQPWLFLMQGKDLGGGPGRSRGQQAEDSRPLPGAINYASADDCRTRLPLFLAQTALFVRLLKARTCYSTAFLPLGSCNPSFLSSLPWGPSPDPPAQAFCAHPGRQVRCCPEGLHPPASEQHRSDGMVPCRESPG